jgi:hypothetical protein
MGYNVYSVLVLRIHCRGVCRCMLTSTHLPCRVEIGLLWKNYTGFIMYHSASLSHDEVNLGSGRRGQIRLPSLADNELPVPVFPTFDGLQLDKY